jgi:hypothetical protein
MHFLWMRGLRASRSSPAQNGRETGKSRKCATILIVSGEIPALFEATMPAAFSVS